VQQKRLCQPRLQPMMLLARPPLPQVPTLELARRLQERVWVLVRALVPAAARVSPPPHLLWVQVWVLF
jgi:hypothetical protein